MNTLPKATFYYLNSHDGYCYILVRIFTIIVTLIKVPIQALLIETNNTKYIGYYVFVTICCTLLYRLSNTLLNSLVATVYTRFYRDSLVLYQELEYGDRNDETGASYLEKVNDASYAIEKMFLWGYEDSINLLTQLIACIYLFWTENQMMLLISLCAVTVIVYQFAVYHLQVKVSLLRKKAKALTSRSKELARLWIPLIRQGDLSSSQIISKVSDARYAYRQTELYWELVNLMTYLPVFIGFFLIYICQLEITATQSVVLIHGLREFETAIRNFMNFGNNYSRLCNDWETFTTFWMGKQFKKKCESENRDVDICDDKSIQILNVNFSRPNDKSFSLIQNFPINLSRNNVLLITGPSGGGKTTWIRCFLGHCKGMNLAHGVPENYSHNVVTCYQDFRDQMPTSTITLNDLFPACTLESMKFYFELCCIPNLIDRIGSTDKNIKDALSGGEKQRLGIATCLARFDTLKRQILILDEPEQGSDLHLAKILINNIIAHVKKRNCILIIITHLNDIPHDQHLSITKGNVTWRTWRTWRGGLRAVPDNLLTVLNITPSIL